MDLGAEPGFDGAVRSPALLETRCQLRAHKQAPVAHGGRAHWDDLCMKATQHSHFWKPDQHWPEYEGDGGTDCGQET